MSRRQDQSNIKWIDMQYTMVYIICGGELKCQQHMRL